MFSGIVEELGVVRHIDGARMTVGCRTVTTDSEVGSSVAVNGVCLTAVERSDGHLAFDLSEETLRRTSLSRLQDGDGVSLTVAALDSTVFSAALIPHTLAVTTLGSARPGDLVNLEVDVIAKYVEALLAGVPGGSTASEASVVRTPAAKETAP